MAAQTLLRWQHYLAGSVLVGLGRLASVGFSGCQWWPL